MEDATQREVEGGTEQGEESGGGEVERAEEREEGRKDGGGSGAWPVAESAILLSRYFITIA